MDKYLSPKRLDCVIPAAGLSSRMGSWKLMLPYQQHTILDASIENTLSFCSRVILVVGHRWLELVEKYKDNERVLLVRNESYKDGMFSSIQQGLKHVESDYFFITHGDMPCIPSYIFHDLWFARGGCTVFPGSAIRPGHPVLIPHSLKNTVINADIKSSMKEILFRDQVKYLDMSCEEIHLDVDTPQAYKYLCEMSH
ncbi:molybdenum cofactor cytidylyltransferase [Photobacterium sanguinicancri]|uniref:molybdenum cofactor cytidylyltransferase n=1 Tax=Photobacterium sanguinicancri TaxID=875932 RepID=UPI0021C3A4D9|nr:molybdenum cofactor cytidylyltransferase [Photobacterium sanguinicancri]